MRPGLAKNVDRTSARLAAGLPLRVAAVGDEVDGARARVVFAAALTGLVAIGPFVVARCVNKRVLKRRPQAMRSGLS